GLDRLMLSGARIRTEGAVALADSPNLAGLRHLDLSYNVLRDRGVLALAGSPHLADLESLNLQDVKAGPRGVEALANSPHLGRLRKLNLNVNNVGRAAQALGGSDRLCALAHLDVMGCNLEPTGVRALLAPTGLPGLTNVSFSAVSSRELWAVEPAAR